MPGLVTETTPMFLVRKPAWHRFGTVLQDYPGREEAMRLAGHRFVVIERAPYWYPDEDSINTARIPKQKLLVKQDMDSGELTPLKVMDESYTVVQNEICWDLIDALIGEGVKYETGGTLDDGALCFVTAWLDEPGTVTGDDSPTWPYGFVNWGHTGNGSITAGSSSIREVCANTVAMAEQDAEAGGRLFRFRHTKNVMSRVEDAKLVIRGISAAHNDYMELAEELAQIRVSENQRELFVSLLIPTPPEALISERVMGNIEKAREQVRGILTEGNTVPEYHQLTAYGLMQAGVEYLDHLRGYRSDYTYMGRTLLRPEPLKAKLVPLIREVARA